MSAAHLAASIEPTPAHVRNAADGPHILADLDLADERTAWIILASVHGLGEGLMGTLLAHFGRASAVLAHAAEGNLRAWAARHDDGTRAFPVHVVDGIEAAARRPAELLWPIVELGLWSLTPLDCDYPAGLRDLPTPPNVLHGVGDRSALQASRLVAVVGTRRPTPAGRTLAARISRRVVVAGGTVVSGLAVGVDGAAHAATIEAGGRTIGVIGAGHAQPGPRAHAALRQRMLENAGAIVSEHHPDVRATKGTYPRRNRIIAALAEAVIVVEAPARSGALITARHGLELGRPVLVAPGRVGDWSVAGSLALLRETPARPLVGFDEMLVDLGYLGESGRSSGRSPVATRVAALAMLGEAERAVAERICLAPAGLDALVAQTGLPPAVVSSAVTLLLIRGWLHTLGPAYLPAGPLLA